MFLDPYGENARICKNVNVMLSCAGNQRPRDIPCPLRFRENASAAFRNGL